MARLKDQARFAAAVARADLAVLKVRGRFPNGRVAVVRWAWERHRWQVRPEVIVTEFLTGKSMRSIARWHEIPLRVVDDVIRWHARRGVRTAATREPA